MLLSRLFIEENNKEHSKKIKGLSDEVKALMSQYPWPGNVRELRNIIERAMILADQDFITTKQLPFELRQIEHPEKGNGALGLSASSEEMSLDENERRHLFKVLETFAWNQSKASKILGISRTTLRTKIRRYHLSKNGGYTIFS